MANTSSAPFFYKNITLLVWVLVFFVPNLALAQIIEPNTDTSSTGINDTTQQKIVDTINFPLSPSALDAEVVYEAADSIIFDVVNKKVYFYKDGKINYQDIKLNAGFVEVDLDKSIIWAKPLKDSTGAIIGKPVFQEGDDDENIADSIGYGIKSKKGIVHNYRRKEGEGYIISEKIKTIKKDDQDVIFGRNNKYTTCDHVDPHFYIQTNNVKIIPKDKIITGPALLYIEKVPLPLVLPFGFFPANSRKSSGIIIPTVGETAMQGFSLRNGGYYFGLSDYYDLALTGDIYTNGSYRLNANTRYAKRYRYNGSVGFSRSRILTARETPNQSLRKDFFFTLNHFSDNKANPTINFQASVNVGSGSFLQLNSTRAEDILNQNLSSTVSFAKRFAGTPFSINSALRHSQNLALGTVDLTLPEVSFNMSRIQPFKGKNAIGNKWYHDIGVSHTLNFNNSIRATDSTFKKDFALRNMRNGFTHILPVSTNFRLGKYISIAPSFNYTGFLYFKTEEFNYNPQFNKVDTTEVSGPSYAYSWNIAVPLSTALYGMVRTNRGKLEAIRHVVRPTLSVNYSPNFRGPAYGYYENILTDSLDGGKYREYSRYETAIFSGPSSRQVGGISLNLSNNLEMKVRQKTDTGFVSKKIKLIDAFDINSAYNFLADSFHLSPVNLSLRTSIYGKLSLNAGGTINPYYLGPDSITRDIYDFQQRKKLGRLTRGTIALSTSLNGKGANEARGYDPRLHLFYPMPYADFSIPWNLGIGYNLQYTKQLFTPEFNQFISLNGELNLTPLWKIRASTNYHITDAKFDFSKVDIYRDLHCWEMSFEWIPFGIRRSYYFTMRIKAPSLQDLKFDKRSDPLDNLF